MKRLLSAPLLATVGGKVDVSNNPALTAVNLGSVNSSGGPVNVSGRTWRLEMPPLPTFTDEQIAGVNLVADVNAALVKGIQNRAPTRGQFIECSFDQPRRPLRPGVKVGPRQGAAEGGMGLQPQPARRLGGVLQLLDCPRGSR